MKTIRITRLALTILLGLSSLSQAQDQLPTSPALERALVIEELEHDLETAASLYAALAADSTLPDPLRRRAALRLGAVRAKLGQHEAARAALGQAAQGEDMVAKLAEQELAGPGDEEKRLAALREEARRLVAGMEDAHFPGGLVHAPSASRLLWIGPAAVPEIVRGIEALRSDPLKGRGEVLVNLASLLWRIGGPEAVAYLDALRTDENLVLRRRVVLGLRDDNARGDVMVALAQKYLSDPDPEGLVPLSVLGGADGKIHSTWQRFSVSALLPLVDAELPEVRVRALHVLRLGWPTLERDGMGPEEAMDLLVPGLRRALDDVRPEVVQAAHRAFQDLGLVSPGSRALLVERFPSLNSDFSLRGALGQSDGSRDSAIAALLPMLHKLGPASSSATVFRDNSVRFLLSFYQPFLKRDSLATVLESNRLGYADVPQVIGWIHRNCQAADADPVIAAVLADPALEGLISWISQQDLEPTHWDSLLSIMQRIEKRNPDYDWTTEDNSRSLLMQAMGRTAAPEAVAYLAEHLKEDSTAILYSAVLQGLLWASMERQEEDVLGALRRALALPVSGTTGNARTKKEGIRQLAFARLVELGDPQAFALLPRAEELGMDPTSLWDSFCDKKLFARDVVDGISALSLAKPSGARAIPFHGYGPEALASIWDALLARPRTEEWNTSWQLLHEVLGGSNWNVSNRPGSAYGPAFYSDVASQVVRVAAERWTLRARQGEQPLSIQSREGLRRLLDMARFDLFEGSPAGDALIELRRASLNSPAADIRYQAIVLLPIPPDENDRTTLWAALEDPSARVARAAADQLFGDQPTIPREAFARLLRHPDRTVRHKAIESYARRVEGGAVGLVTATLADGADPVRQAACEYLGTQADSAPIPELLKALTDPATEVRTAAAGALRAIRFYHDEKSYWDRVFAGTELSANGAAEALLEQAAPHHPHEVRLLAIRSLGTLGVAETLPFLITWTGDADRELAAAARAAIDAIHQRGD